MPAIHLFPTSKIPFFFTLSFFIDSYCKKQNKKNKDVDLLCTLPGPYRKMQRFYTPLTVTAQSTKSRRKNLKY